MTDALPGSGPLRGPVMLAAFEGWNDAGGAATQALVHLHEMWGAEQVDELDPEDYHDFQVNRPTIALTDDGRREITWPTTSVAVAARPTSSDPVVQGLLLTAIVISLGSYCLILGMVEVAANRFNSVDSHEIDQLKG